MAGAMLEGWLAKGADPARFTVIRPSGRDAAPGVRVLTRLPQGDVPALALLGVKPQKLGEVAPELAAALGPHTILVSILAGVELATLRRHFPGSNVIVRAMPNLPVRLGSGVIGLFADRADGPESRSVEALMDPLGQVEWFENEALLDVVTVLGGSSPAFLYRFIDALAQAGEEQGLPADQAHRIALATVAGAAALARASGEAPAALAERVASPGGTTRAGLEVLDADERLRTLIRETMAAAVRRGREMAEEARRCPS